MKSIGIDFGTGNSALAFNHGDEFIVFDRVGDSGIVPSDILMLADAILPDPTLLTRPPEGAILWRGIKRLLLNSIDDQTIDRTVLTELAVARLKYIYDEFLKEHGEPFNAVLTCPANTGQVYRELLLDIGSRVGLPQVDVVDEPTAAALFHGLREVGGDDEEWLAVDWGSGTCDVSLIRREQGAHELQVLHVEGDNTLGGLDMDNALLDYLSQRSKLDVSLLPPLQVEAIKKQLSAIEQVETTLQLTDGAELKIALSRSELEQVTAPLLRRAQDLIVRAMEQAGCDTTDQIIATGGPIHMPSVRRAIVLAGEGQIPPDQEYVDRAMLWSYPLASVARGAAQLAYLKRTGGFAVPTKVTKTIGIRVMDGGNDDAYYPVIRRGETRPVTRPVLLATSIDLQDVIQIEVREGDFGHTARANTLLGQLRIVVRPENRGAVRVKLRLHLNDSGRWEASAQAVGDANSIRGVNFQGVAADLGTDAVPSAELRIDDPVSEFEATVMQNEVDPDTARQLYDRLKIKYHPDRDPKKKKFWLERLQSLDEAFARYEAEISRRIRSASLPQIEWSDRDELLNTAVDEVLAQRLTHCLALRIRDDGDPQSETKIVWLLKRFPDYRRVLASYLFTLQRNPVLQELLANDDRPHVGFVVLLQNVPGKTVRERHEVLKAAYRMPEDRVRELLANPHLNMDELYERVRREAPEALSPGGGGSGTLQSHSGAGRAGSKGLTFSYSGGNTYIGGNTYNFRDVIKSKGCKWDADKKQWVAYGEHLTEKDFFPDA